MKSKKKILEILTSDLMDWTLDECTATHKPTGITFWTGNGFLLFYVEGLPKPVLGFLGRLKLWIFLKRCKNQQIINKWEKIANTKAAR